MGDGMSTTQSSVYKTEQYLHTVGRELILYSSCVEMFASAKPHEIVVLYFLYLAWSESAKCITKIAHLHIATTTNLHQRSSAHRAGSAKRPRKVKAQRQKCKLFWLASVPKKKINIYERFTQIPVRIQLDKPGPCFCTFLRADSRWLPRHPYGSFSMILPVSRICKSDSTIVIGDVWVIFSKCEEFPVGLILNCFSVQHGCTE